MNQTHFNRLVSKISSDLLILKDYGQPITNELVEKKVEDSLRLLLQEISGFEVIETDVDRLKFTLRNMFNVSVDEELMTLFNPDAIRWFDSKKSEIDWTHWNAYKELLLSQARAIDVIDSNEEVIDNILDYSGDPTLPGPWARKGLVMGNVQSGKTQNYIGLINKAIDAGYKVIILLGGHLVDLRKQTQERVDEGVLGRESRHILANIASPGPIGVGMYGVNVDTGTTTLGDFDKRSADMLGVNLNGSNPFIFTIRKSPGGMKRLYDWIKDYHFLSPENGKKMEVPLLLIDDEADYASINTKHHKDEVTATNDAIRNLLSLFNKNTYVGYTATPFANVFIDPDDSLYSDEDDLFPSDFMIKIPTPNNYMGQEYFFGLDTAEEDKDMPIIEIGGEDDSRFEEIYELKKDAYISSRPKSLEQAIRAFIIVIAIRNIRGEKSSHNTMLVNISHLKVHQNRLELLIGEYRKEIYNALNSFSNLGIEKASKNPLIKDIEITFNDVFNVKEEYSEIFIKLRDAVGKINVWAINQGNKSADNKNLDYSSYKEHGLNVIVIGGHKLSRGLTLEGLSISYFARNSKAYDTLMQMCRWFGYRPTYRDLCKVYLPKESQNWYSHIASAIRELYGELDLMSKAEKRPKDFGLKVREHPGAMIITAKNKVGSAESEIRSQDLWGQVQRRFRFNASKDINDRNVKYTEKFVQNMFDKTSSYDSKSNHNDGKPYVFSDVEYSDLIDFIKNIDLPEDDIGNTALINHLLEMEKAGLSKAKVALFTQGSPGKVEWDKPVYGLSNDEREFINTPFSFCSKKIVMPKRAMKFVDGKIFEIPSVHLGNSDDEKIFLSSEAINKVKELSTSKKKPVSFDYIASEERDFPGLIIYLFAVAYKEPWWAGTSGIESSVQLGHGLSPTLGYCISLPRSEEIKVHGMSQKEIKALVRNTRHSYQINKVQQRLKSTLAYTESIEDE